MSETVRLRAGRKSSLRTPISGCRQKWLFFATPRGAGWLRLYSPCRTWLGYMATNWSGGLFRKIFKFKTYINQVVGGGGEIVVLIAPLIAGVVLKIGSMKALKAFVSVG